VSTPASSGRPRASLDGSITHAGRRTIAALGVTLLLAGCAPEAPASPSAADDTTASIVGRYDCQQPGASETDDVELREDGTLTISQPALGSSVEGTWSLEGNAGVFTIEGADEPFSIDGNRLVFDDGTICTKAS
jgi:hypothetical protein